MSLFRAIAPAVTFSAGMSLIDVFQASTGTRVVRIYRIYAIQAEMGIGASALNSLQIKRTTNAQGGLTIIPDPADILATSLTTGISAGTYRDVVESDLFRQVLWDNGSVGYNVAPNLSADMEMQVPISEIWNAGYVDTVIQPLTCRPGQGITLRHDTGANGGNNSHDFEIEFSDDAT